MKRIEFETYDHFLYKVHTYLNELREIDQYSDISIIAKCNEATMVIKRLLCLDYDIACMHFEIPYIAGYEDEYIISILNIGENPEIWCEPLKRNGQYIKDESVLTFIIDNCSSTCIPNCIGKTVVEISIKH